MKFIERNTRTTLKRSLYIILVFASCFLIEKSHAQSDVKLRKVVLDAGHGGSDPGNLGTKRYNTTEKDITLSVTLKLGAYIEELLPDVEVIYTRNDDSFPSLKERVAIANEANADLFISIHCDAFTKSSAKGSGTYVMGMHKTKESLRVAMKENAAIYSEENYEDNYNFDPTDPDTYLIMALRQNVFLDNSLSLSNKIQSQFRDRVGRVDRGVKQAGFWVISYTTMPSVLVEMGFLTNADEEDYLNSEQGQDYIASAIYRAFRDYKIEIEKNTPESTPSESNVLPPGEYEADDKTVSEETIVDESVKPYTNINKGLEYKKIKNGIRFQVQILGSSQKLDKSSSEFKGIEKVDEYFSNGLFKYAVGNCRDYKKAKDMQKILRDNGFEGAFIIAFEDDERIDLHQAVSALN